MTALVWISPVLAALSVLEKYIRFSGAPGNPIAAAVPHIIVTSCTVAPESPDL